MGGNTQKVFSGEKKGEEFPKMRENPKKDWVKRLTRPTPPKE